MSDLLALLDQLDEARAKATPGPWAQHPSDPAYVLGEVSEGEEGLEYLDVADCGGRGPWYPRSPEPDAALIVAAVNALPKLTAALRAAMEEHDGRSCCDRTFESLRGYEPCPTVQAITDALTPEPVQP